MKFTITSKLKFFDVKDISHELHSHVSCPYFELDHGESTFYFSSRDYRQRANLFSSEISFDKGIKVKNIKGLFPNNISLELGKDGLYLGNTILRGGRKVFTLMGRENINQSFKMKIKILETKGDDFKYYNICEFEDKYSEGFVSTPFIYYCANFEKYYMFYLAKRLNKYTENDGYSLKLSTSKDGKSWEISPNFLFDDFPHRYMAKPYLLPLAGKFILFFSYIEDSEHYKIGYSIFNSLEDIRGVAINKVNNGENLAYPFVYTDTSNRLKLLASSGDLGRSGAYLCDMEVLSV